MTGRRRAGSLLALSFVLAAPVVAQGTIRGTVHDSLITGRPLVGATVVLQGAPQTAVTDRFGRFTLRAVPAGTYGIGFFHPILDSLEVTAPLRRVTVGPGGTTNLTLGMPTVGALSQTLCGREPEPFTAVVFGVARDAERGEPLAGAVVRVHWFAMLLSSGVASESQRFESDTTATDGRYVLCGVPNDIALTMSASLGGQMTGDLHLALDRLGIGRRDLMVSRTDTAARALPVPADGDTVPPRRASGSARLRVTVRSAQGRPVQGATVGVRGTAASGVTGADGSVRLSGSPAGSQTLLVRRVGSQPVTRVVALRSNTENDVSIELGQNVVELPAVAVTGQRPNALDRDIKRRLGVANGQSFDEKQLEVAARGNMGFWAMIRGMRVTSDGFDALPYMLNSYNQPCRPVLWYNGSRLYQWDAWELRILLVGAKRMEVYPRPGNVPPEFFSNQDCGAIVVWS